MFFQLIFNPFRKSKELEDFQAFPAKWCVLCIEMFAFDLTARTILSVFIGD